MRCLAGRTWQDGFLDPHRRAGEYRVRVLAWRGLERLDDAFFVRPRSLRLVWNYVREIGAVAVARKVVSREGERLRNDKWVGAGIGRVLETGADGRFPAGSLVCFVAPFHPACAERVTLPSALLAECAGAAGLREGRIAYIAGPARGQAWWAPVRGWHPDSGADPRSAAAVMGSARDLVESSDWSRARVLDAPGSPPAEQRGAEPRPRPGRPTAALYGYGNYAKTLVLPHVRPFLDVTRIHEVDPAQVPRGGGPEVAWDTAPAPRAGDRHDVVLVAGFHHTHAPIAASALRRGAWAVVEKPVVTTEAQLDDLLDALRGGERMYSCFHKRYLPMNAWARRDLGTAPGEPISYHCIVYEVPLPELHWYRWPSSRTRLTSNGCHWIDHFLYLNDFAEVVSHDLAVAPDGTINATAVLANGAVFTMVLTERGSERIGMQDHVELRAGGTTVRMVNGGRYDAEGPDRVLRRRRINKMVSYRRMYRTIGARIRDGLPGDSAASVRVSAGLVLAMERRLHQRLEELETGSAAVTQSPRTSIPTIALS